MTWHATEVMRSIYELDGPDPAGELVTQLSAFVPDDSPSRGPLAGPHASLADG